MPRHKDVNWNCETEGHVTTADAQLAVLMDLRDELKALNRTLGCYRVTRGMDALHSIDRRLAKHLPHRKPRKK